jgi:hypothetical protein
MNTSKDVNIADPYYDNIKEDKIDKVTRIKEIREKSTLNTIISKD